MSGNGIGLGLVGLGSIGTAVAEGLKRRPIPGLSLVFVAARDVAKAEATLERLGVEAAVLTLDETMERADLVLDCAAPAAFEGILHAAIAHRTPLATVSTGALGRAAPLVERAREAGCEISVISGAILGIDGLLAAAEGEIVSVGIVTRKPPLSLGGSPYVEENGIDLAAISEPTRIFAGNANEATRGFPSNVNVAATVALAGVGLENTSVEIWADPTVDRNQHTLSVESDCVSFEARVAAKPSPENPKTSLLTSRSVLAWLRKHAGSLKIGT